jgi:Cof subfamily protein (haloacid dehalogenase superfamily)
VSDIKLIVTDLDDTLLRTDKTISQYTVSVLQRCRSCGIKIAYATGRGGTADEVAPAEYFDARIVMNGALAYVGDTIVYRRLIPFQTARPLLVACNRRGMRIASEVSGMHYSNFIVTEEWSNITNYTITDFSEHELDAEKLYTRITNQDDLRFVEDNLPETLSLLVARDKLAMIMHAEATKAKAVAELARYWSIAQSESVVFGDDVNDIDMLLSAGIGVAVGNAIDEVKSVADHVCGDCDDDGVARWIDENVL